LRFRSPRTFFHNQKVLLQKSRKTFFDLSGGIRPMIPLMGSLRIGFFPSPVKGIEVKI
jgi:hypothetical protein